MAAVGGGEGVAEMAAVAVRTGVAGKDHAADLSLVAGVADDGAELTDAVCELAVLAVGALPGLLPLVAQLRLEHPLVVHLQLQRPRCRCLLGRGVFALASPASNVHPLLLPFIQHGECKSSAPINNYENV